MEKYYYYFCVFYRCIIDTLVYTSDYYYSYEECLKLAKSCEDKDHFAIVHKELRRKNHETNNT